jgi:hypothetical protein
MAYFIFQKNKDNVPYTLYRIVENQIDLNNLNIIQNDYKIIQDLDANFNEVKLGTKFPISYTNDIITYQNTVSYFKTKKDLDEFIKIFLESISIFLENNINHPDFQKWNSFKTQLNNINTSTFIYPFEKSIQQYFSEQGQAFLNPLQLP